MSIFLGSEKKIKVGWGYEVWRKETRNKPIINTCSHAGRAAK